MKTQRHLSAHSSGHAPYCVTPPMQSETMETQRRLTGGLPQRAAILYRVMVGTGVKMHSPKNICVTLVFTTGFT